MCDGLAARGCTCPALGALPEGCVEIASNSYALKLRVLVSVVVCSADGCDRLHGQLEEQAQRRGRSAEMSINVCMIYLGACYMLPYVLIRTVLVVSMASLCLY